MLCWHRFDLIDSTYAVALMADVTPAWREVYGRILDELIFRHTGWWAASDWLTQIGHDPDRADYPDLYRLLIPEHLWGNYDVPGLDRERHRAVGPADGPDRRRRQPVLQGLLPRDARPAPAHDRRRAVERAVRHRPRRREHLHVVPLRDRRAPARAVDRARPTAATARTPRSGRTASPARASACSCTTCCAAPTTTTVFDALVDRRVPHQVPASRRATSCRRAVTLYYDPILDVHHEVPAMVGMVPAPYLAPQVPDDARRLFEAGMSQLGLWEPTGPVAPPGTAHVGDCAVDGQGVGPAPHRRRARRRRSTSTTSRRGTRARGEFTWGFELDEPHPRGQYNGTMAAAQVATEGSWWRLANVGPGNRFDEPTVVGVDFPTVALREARWDPATSTLTVTPVGIGDATGRTTFRVTTIGDPNQWTRRRTARRRREGPRRRRRHRGRHPCPRRGRPAARSGTGLARAGPGRPQGGNGIAVRRRRTSTCGRRRRSGRPAARASPGSTCSRSRRASCRAAAGQASASTGRGSRPTRSAW